LSLSSIYLAKRRGSLVALRREVQRKANATTSSDNDVVHEAPARGIAAELDISGIQARVGGDSAKYNPVLTSCRK
jgi:hypothetical protein